MDAYDHYWKASQPMVTKNHGIYKYITVGMHDMAILVPDKTCWILKYG